MSEELKNLRGAVLATDGFERAELTEPVKALRQKGATVDIVSLHAGEIQGMQHKEKGDKVPVGRTLDQPKPEDYAALVLSGGVANPDTLRTDP
jgi:protease I